MKKANEMTMEQWFQSLSEKEISKIKNKSELFPNPGETLEKWNERKKEKYSQTLEDEYKKSLEEMVKADEKIKTEEEIKSEEERQYQQDLKHGIATIQLYKSNKFDCWAAEVTGLDSKWGFIRKFIKPVAKPEIYEFENGKIYNYLVDQEQHYVKVEKSKLIELTKREVTEIFESKSI